MVVSSFGVIALMMGFTDSDDNDDDAADGAYDVFVSTTVYSAILFLSLFIISLWLDCSVGLLSPCHRDVKLVFFVYFIFWIEVLKQNSKQKEEKKSYSKQTQTLQHIYFYILIHIHIYLYTYIKQIT